MVPDNHDDGRLIGIITTEHFTLQTARSATISEANGRASSYLTAVSSGLIAIAFVGQRAELGTVFHIFGLLVLGPLVFLGVTTFERALQSAIEDASYASRINRLRRFYFRLGVPLEEYLLNPVERDDVVEVMGQTGVNPKILWQPFLTVSGTVAVINSFLLAAFVAFVVRIAGGGLRLAIPIGALFFLIGVAGHLRRQMAAWHRVAPRAGTV